MSVALRHDEQAEPCCEICSTPLLRRATGRPRHYCSSRCRQKAARSRHIVAVLLAIEVMKADLAIDARIDWTDEDHRVA
ncbi:MAG TPA: hypothetical protein VM687_11115 [Stenotrophomonas sp.]|nr:hypothetical protein [Stenotrophomonas sp.]